MPWLFQKAPKRISKFPPAIHPREPPVTVCLCSSLQRIQNISRMHWEHFAAIVSRAQQRTEVQLCRSCAGVELVVESEGKTGGKASAGGFANNHSDSFSQRCRRVVVPAA